MEKFKINITDWLEKYDKNKETYSEILKGVEYYSYFIHDDELTNDKIVFYDANHKKIMDADFEFIGVYFVMQRIWLWAWSIARLKKKWISKSKKILQYGFSLDENNDHLKLELINSRFIITDPIQIDIHLAIASELSKIPFIYQMVRYIDSTKEEIITSDAQQIIKIHKNPDFSRVQLNYLFLYNIRNFK